MTKLVVRTTEKPKNRVFQMAAWPFENFYECLLSDNEAIETLRKGEQVFNGWHFASKKTVNKFSLSGMDNTFTFNNEKEALTFLKQLSEHTLSERGCEAAGEIDSVQVERAD